MINGRFRVLVLGACAAAALAILPAACQQDKRQSGPIPTDPQDRISRSMFPALRGTIGEYAMLLDANPIAVEGYGVVAGLPNTGSGDMDPRIRELLINRLVSAGVGLYTEQTESIRPEVILASDQVAAVEVRGVIPAMAHKGSTFDLYVNAVPNSQATSLANGLLWTSDLKVIGLTLDGNDSRTLAMGRGPVFIPAPLEAASKGPDYKPPADAPKALRTGRVLGGGLCMDDRPARLQLYVPNYRVSAAIEHAVNARFPGRDKAATADGEAIIALHVPAEYRENPGDFVDIVRHLYLAGEDPGFNEKQARALVEALKLPDSPHRDLALSLQGLGRSILPDYIQPNYTSPDPQLRFWAARAGANMHDVQGLTILQEIMRDPSSPLRRQAMMALIEASRGRDIERATIALVDMLNSPNTDERILAYHALLAIQSRAVATYSVGRKFVIDIVPADSPPLIYVLEADSPRIAFIGRPIALPPGALFISKDNLLTVSAVDEPVEADAGGGTGMVLTASSVGGDKGPSIDAPAQNKSNKETVTLYWRSPLGEKKVSLRAQPNVPAIVARVTWIPDPLNRDTFDPKTPFIGATYQRITEMLASMCAEKIIDAKFVAQHAQDLIITPTDLALGGRPEGSTEVTPPPAPVADPLATPEMGAPTPAAAPVTPPTDLRTK